MLMVDGVKFGVFYQVEGIWRLNNQDPLIRKRKQHIPQKTVHIIDMREYVGCGDCIRFAMLLDDFKRYAFLPELRNCCNSFLIGLFREVLCRVNSEHFKSFFPELPQKAAIIACDV